MHAELVCVAMVIENEIAQGCTQKSVALTYRLALQASYPTDWERVNAMIIARWSRTGLKRIKRMAWDNRPVRTA